MINYDFDCPYAFPEITKETPSDSLQPVYTEDGTRPFAHPLHPLPRNQARQAVIAGRQYQQQLQQVLQNQQRWFVALYDYDPLSASPNPETADEELPFRGGDIIKVSFNFNNYFNNF